MGKPLILVSNPGSASRKYALFEGDTCRAHLHFEYDDERIIYSINQKGQHQKFDIDLDDIANAGQHVVAIMYEHNILNKTENIDAVGLRIVVPSSFFLEDRELTENVIAKLEEFKARAPLHIEASLRELSELRQQFADIPIYGISDSAFHSTKPDYAWNYGLPLTDTDRLDIKRFGYHGLAVASAVHQLHAAGKPTPKVVVVHLGSGASVTAVHHGKSIDNTMGYSPLEGLIMSTRSGSVDVTAAQVLQAELGFNESQLDEYLNYSSGLLGLGGSADIRELLKRQASDDHQAELALNTYVYAIQKAIGAATATLEGIDALVFTGTVGERSVPIRQNIVQRFDYLDLVLDQDINKQCTNPQELTRVSRLTRSKPIYVVPIDEAAEMARRILALLATQG